MQNNDMHGVRKVECVSDEIALISNQTPENAAYSECIRIQMVKFQTRNNMLLNITESEQYTNNHTCSMSYIKEKMICG